MSNPILPTDLAFTSLPRISAGLFARILARNASPAAPYAAQLAAIPESYNLDRAIALAFFRHESTYGTRGVARQSLNWGNLRSGVRALKTQNAYAYYRNWGDSLNDWCQLIKVRYVGRGLLTVRQALPTYAPSSDGNAPHAYANAVIADVARWMAEDQLPSPPPPAGQLFRVRKVVTAGATIRSAPRTNASVLGRLKAGQEWRGEPVEGSQTTVAGIGSGKMWVRSHDMRFVLGLLLEEVPE